VELHFKITLRSAVPGSTRKKKNKGVRSGKLLYICRLFCKELVRHNFPGLPTDELLERMIELSLYTEEHLK
jgi:hypothetical protein